MVAEESPGLLDPVRRIDRMVATLIHEFPGVSESDVREEFGLDDVSARLACRAVTLCGYARWDANDRLYPTMRWHP